MKCLIDGGLHSAFVSHIYAAIRDGFQWFQLEYVYKPVWGVGTTYAQRKFFDEACGLILFFASPLNAAIRDGFHWFQFV